MATNNALLKTTTTTKPKQNKQTNKQKQNKTKQNKNKTNNNNNKANEVTFPKFDITDLMERFLACSETILTFKSKTTAR